MDRAGAETMVMNLYREINRSKFQFDFVYFTGERCDYDDEIESLGGRIYRIPSRNIVSRFVALWRLLCRGHWTIAHAHTLFSSGLHLLAARLAGVPHRVAHSHNTHDVNSTSVAGRIYQSLMRRLLWWVASSRVACGMAASEYLFSRKSEIIIIPNAIDIDRFSGASGARVRRQLALAEDCLIILQVGRYMPVKNHAFSVQIASVLRNKGINFRMLFVGVGPEKHSVQSAIDSLNLLGWVELLGSRTDVDELMAAADVMLMPSVHEGFPVVLVEAQAAGLPAVVSHTISPEVDLGVGLITVVELDASAQTWADALCLTSRSEIPDNLLRKRALNARGFSSKAGARLLETVYSEK